MIAERLMAHGLPATTSVLLMSDVSHPTQMRLRVRLSELSQAVTKFPPGAPLIVLIGEATAAASSGAAAPHDVFNVALRDAECV
ncbi:MAG TPA: hypothetical protein VNH44_12850, partial [Micropepsaceae bacterium]|nr:hypothetical protein [Micropepsaceae bacterium]